MTCKNELIHNCRNATNMVELSQLVLNKTQYLKQQLSTLVLINISLLLSICRVVPMDSPCLFIFSLTLKDKAKVADTNQCVWMLWP